ncbi:phage-related tail protein [Sporosarcina luteola]|nr:phage-related tail protein [Sporosarcina luteola]
MYEQKTKVTDQSVIEFIEQVESPKKRADAYRLLDLFRDTTGYEAKMWGPSMIGFGKYHYVYASGHEGDAPLVGFSPRKAKISLYFATGDPDREDLLQQFGKHTAGKACVYINKLDDVDEQILQQLITQSVRFLQELYPEQK